MLHPDLRYRLVVVHLLVREKQARLFLYHALFWCILGDIFYQLVTGWTDFRQHDHHGSGVWYDMVEKGVDSLVVI
jgi:hypothetical protein